MNTTSAILVFCLTVTIISVIFLGHFGLDTGLNEPGTGGVDAWSDVTTYNQGDKVTHDGYVYHTSWDNNLNNDPSTYENWGWFQKLFYVGTMWWDCEGEETMLETDVDTSIFNSLSNGLGIYTQLMFFSVADIPSVFSWFFWFLTIIELWCVVSLIRGTS